MANGAAPELGLSGGSDPPREAGGRRRPVGLWTPVLAIAGDFLKTRCCGRGSSV